VIGESLSKLLDRPFLQEPFKTRPLVLPTKIGQVGDVLATWIALAHAMDLQNGMEGLECERQSSA